MSESPPALPASSRPWLVRCWLLTFFLIIAITAHGYVFLIASPKFEKIFEDMLGSRDKLPDLTRVILGWARLMQNNVLLLLPLSALPIVLLWRSRGSRLWCVLVSAASVLLILISLTGVVAMFQPLTQIIQNVSEPR